MNSHRQKKLAVLCECCRSSDALCSDWTCTNMSKTSETIDSLKDVTSKRQQRHSGMTSKLLTYRSSRGPWHALSTIAPPVPWSMPSWQQHRWWHLGLWSTISSASKASALRQQHRLWNKPGRTVSTLCHAAGLDAGVGQNGSFTKRTSKKMKEWSVLRQYQPKLRVIWYRSAPKLKHEQTKWPPNTSGW